MSKYTPGPWIAHVSKVEEETGNDVMLIRSQNPIRGITGIEIESDECEANARLIAAAPEMLEFLKEIHTKHNFDAVDEEEYNWLEERLENLIAKAEGA